MIIDYVVHTFFYCSAIILFICPIDSAVCQNVEATTSFVKTTDSSSIVNPCDAASCSTKCEFLFFLSQCLSAAR